ncbi:Multicopper oxidase [Pleurostoma richardsiae]|uniref:laccase n=1 Tax=Pleurostoma richardsiae TaxID=41990 RepID=A0AA38RBW0_9PEZI|nr:Multicopper oxidase [Pleurostoma richardsiae]
MLSHSLLALGGLMSLTTLAPLAAAAPYDNLNPVPSSSTCNTPSNRSCWTDGFNIDTDYETYVPTTNLTRLYIFNLTEADNYIGADGVVKKKAMLINGAFPGPVIQADWGDTIEVQVINNLETNGTSIHWHGLRQFDNNINDGTNGITECPIPPGHNKTYTFRAAQYGTSWYHSHFSSQYAYGVTGSIQINGPASASYDVDLGVMPISDWYYETADTLLARVSDPNDPFIPGLAGSPPPSDNVFFNGTNIDPAGSGGGSYARVTLTPGLTHRLRLINPSVDNTFTVSIVGHDMTVIATDFVPVNPVTVDSIYMGVGQRYDILIDANQTVGNYWMNVTYSSALVCGSSNNPYPAAIISYAGADDGLPTDLGSPPPDTFCADSTDFTPVLNWTGPVASFNATPSDTLSVAIDVDTNISKVFWTVNGSSIDVQWDQPTLQYILDGDTTDFPAAENVIQPPDSSLWSFWLIENVSPIPHPMHLHGHDFLIVGRSDALANPLDPSAVPVSFDPSTDAAKLNGNNPTRRDTTMLPAYGWLVVAFKTDNPGSWLFHCHISWHASQGLSVQFLERAGDIASSMDLSQIEDNCAAWKAYTGPAQVDSGL